ISRMTTASLNVSPSAFTSRMVWVASWRASRALLSTASRASGCWFMGGCLRSWGGACPGGCRAGEWSREQGALLGVRLDVEQGRGGRGGAGADPLGAPRARGGVLVGGGVALARGDV